MRELTGSIRSLRRAPLLLATAVLTLGLGLGTATGVLGVAYALLWRPLPFNDAGRLVLIRIHPVSEPQANIGVGLVLADEWRRRTTVLDSLAGYSTAEFTVRGAGEPRSTRVAMVTDGFFETLDPLGTTGRPHGVAAGQALAAVSASFATDAGWSVQAPTGVLSLGPRQFDVTAVMPRSFAFPSAEVAVWVSATAVDRISLFEQDDRRFRLIGRLRPGATLQQARGELEGLAASLNAGERARDHVGVSLEPLERSVREPARTALLPFIAGAILVLAVSAANVSGLLVGRGAARWREVAVRRALGASAPKILAGVAGEGLWIALGGWLVGLLVARIVVMGFVVLGGASIPDLTRADLDPRVIAASLVLALLVGLACGLPHAIRAVRGASPGLLQGHVVAGGGHGWLRGALVVGQIMSTVVLLVSAGLLTRTVMTLVQAGTGFELRQGLATRLMLSETIRYRTLDRLDYLNRLLSEVRTLPGVATAGVGSDLPPLGAQLEMTLRIETDGGQSEIFPLSFSAVTPGYLEALGVTRLSGRLFEERDRSSTVPSVVISRSAARKVFGDRDPVGREWAASIPTPAGNVKPRVIGVVADVKSEGLERMGTATIFAPWEVFAPSQAYLVVRTSVEPTSINPALRDTIRRLDPTLPVFSPQTLEEVFSGALAERQLRARLAAAFAGLALVLAAVALWGAVAQGVIDRRREIAIRMAIGSTGPQAVRLVLRSGTVLITLGVGLGLLAAAGAAQALRHLLHGVSPIDPTTFGVVGLAVGALAVLASYAPARAAAAISPAELLREG